MPNGLSSSGSTSSMEFSGFTPVEITNNLAEELLAAEKKLNSEKMSSQTQSAYGISNQEITQQSNKRIRQYPVDYVGPFIVFIRELEAPLNLIKITKYMNKHFNSMKLIKPITSKKFKVQFNNIVDANNLVHDQYISKSFHAYIPSKDVEIEGNIYLPEDIDFNEFKSVSFGGLKFMPFTKIKIINANRNMKKNSNDELIALKTVRVVFEGNVIPDFVNYYNCLIPVKIYFNKIYFCNKCLNYNHSEKYCTNRPKCDRCLGEHETKDCTISCFEPIKCKYCDEFHNSGDKSCPFRQKVLQHKVENTLKTKVKLTRTFSEILQDDESLLQSLPGQTLDSPIASTSFDSRFISSQPSNARKHFKISRSRKLPIIQKQIEINNSDFSIPSNDDELSSSDAVPAGFKKVESSIRDFIMNFCKEVNMPSL